MKVAQPNATRSQHTNQVRPSKRLPPASVVVPENAAHGTSGQRHHNKFDESTNWGGFGGTLKHALVPVDLVSADPEWDQ